MNPEKLKYYLQKSKMNTLQKRLKKNNKEKHKRKEEPNFMVISKNSNFWLKMVLNI
jgi:hypothetical protein